MARGLFAGVEKAIPSERGVYFVPGLYTVEIEECKAFIDRKKITRFVVDFVILESSNPSRPVSSHVNWMQDISTEDKGGMGRVRGFIQLALQEPNIDEVTEEVCDFTYSAKQPLRGVVMRCEATESAKDPEFSNCKWFFVRSAKG